MWVLLSNEPSETSEAWIDGRHRGLQNPRLDEMLEIIDETEGMVQTRRDLRGC